MDAQNVKQTDRRLTKREFISYMADRNSVSPKEASDIYDMVVGSIIAAVEDGWELCLMGFGKFYLQTHKGHPVRFKSEEGKQSRDTEVPDYTVFKFSASNALNQHIRNRVAGGGAGQSGGA